MNGLQVFLFGNVHVTHANGPAGIKLTRITQTLLAYLVLHRQRSHSREVLVELFWGHTLRSQAQNCLSTALWRLRRALEPEGVPRGTYLITTPDGQVRFNAESDCWLDVAQFETQVGQSIAQCVNLAHPDEAVRLEQALALYTGELIEGLYVDWALQEREHLRQLYLNGLACLMCYHERQGRPESSLLCGQRILNLDPLREDIHREMMRLYCETGQRALAVRQYEACCKALSQELGLMPMEETQALYAQITQADTLASGRGTPEGQPLNLQRALQQLSQAIRTLDEAHRQLQEAVCLVKRFTGQSDPDCTRPSHA
jgi:DNA-binding SARP family transcriptional activator